MKQNPVYRLSALHSIIYMAFLKFVLLIKKSNHYLSVEYDFQKLSVLSPSFWSYDSDVLNNKFCFFLFHLESSCRFQFQMSAKMKINY